MDFVSPTPALFELGAPLGHDSAHASLNIYPPQRIAKRRQAGMHANHLGLFITRYNSKVKMVLNSSRQYDTTEEFNVEMKSRACSA